ncbi:hypothetical protein BJP36_37865 [Moorena producens JHB]|uniref:Uncharacterized protein n=1 Tax=Moorena producens (strain JHB) TaxID=1454205 RepID=A0A9Q9SUG0_MOOP1|nr:hypothetical protein [Moorena producens]WAN69864.1 hypothetical protein BJP36_37865 [Moorena producens JHB]
MGGTPKTALPPQDRAASLFCHHGSNSYLVGRKAALVVINGFDQRGY